MFNTKPDLVYYARGRCSSRGAIERSTIGVYGRPSMLHLRASEA